MYGTVKTTVRPISNSIFIRQCADRRSRRSLDDSTGIFVLNMLVGLSRPPPHLQIFPWQKSAMGLLFTRGDYRQMNPGHGRVLVMRAMPVMVQPDRIDWFADKQVSGAAGDVPLGAIMMDVLHR